MEVHLRTYQLAPLTGEEERRVGHSKRAAESKARSMVKKTAMERKDRAESHDEMAVEEGVRTNLLSATQERRVPVH